MLFSTTVTPAPEMCSLAESRRYRTISRRIVVVGYGYFRFDVMKSLDFGDHIFQFSSYIKTSAIILSLN